MKVGGNQSFAEWLTKHPSHSSSTDIKDRYTTKSALSYREELQRRVTADEAIFGKGRVIIDGGVVVEEPKPSDADFFDTWDKAPVNTTKAIIPAANLMSFGGGSNGTTPLSSQPGSRSASPALSATTTPPIATPAAPRTVTSSSLRTSAVTRARPALGTRTASGTTTLGATKTSKLGGKLGVKKGGPAVNFEEAERKAKEEEERIKRLGYDSRLEAEAAAATALIAKSTSLNSASSRNKDNGKKESSSGETERLGMGIKRLGFGQTMGMSGAESAKNAAAAEKLATRRANGYDDEPGAFRLPLLFFRFSWLTLLRSLSKQRLRVVIMLERHSEIKRVFSGLASVNVER